MLKTDGPDIAYLICVYDLGIYPSTFKGVTEYKPMLELVFEFATLTKEGKNGPVPLTTTVKITKYSNEKATAPIIANALGFSIEGDGGSAITKKFIDAIGSACLIEPEDREFTKEGKIINYIKPKTYLKIPTIMNNAVTGPTIPTMSFSFESKGWMTEFSKLPEWKQSDIKKSQSFMNTGDEKDSVNDDLPF